MIKQVINIADLKSVVTAIDNLQEAGKMEDAKRLLSELAKDIMEALK